MRKRARSLWVREIFQRRTEMGEYHALISEMRLVDHESFYRYFHMTPQRFDNLLSLVGPLITRQATVMRSPISAGERLAVTIRYLVTGDAMQTISFSFRLGHSTVCGIIDNTCDAIWNALSPDYLRTPRNSEEWRRISAGFESAWNFPHCIGAIDGKHVVMQAPSNSGSEFYNYKGTHSIVLMAVCDSNYCFTLLDIGNYGRHSDGGVLSNSVFGQAMERGSLGLPDPDYIGSQRILLPYYFVGDSAFPLKTYMLRPYPGKYLDDQKRIFNYRLSRARRIIENAFGILATKFRIFRRPIIAEAEKVTKITKAACALHNFLKISEAQNPASLRVYCPPGYIDHEDRQGNVIHGDWRQYDSSGLCAITHVGSNRFSKSAGDMRDTLKSYFSSSEGAVPWQQHHIHST